jgi:hypothetical protein
VPHRCSKLHLFQINFSIGKNRNSTLTDWRLGQSRLLSLPFILHQKMVGVPALSQKMVGVPASMALKWWVSPFFLMVGVPASLPLLSRSYLNTQNL